MKANFDTYRLLLAWTVVLAFGCGSEPVAPQTSANPNVTDAFQDPVISSDRGTCRNGAARNACGGCLSLAAQPGTACEPDSSLDNPCDAGRWDCEPDNPDEVVCTPVQRTPEVCDGLDNNCNGSVDEGFDVSSDPQHCGECGYVCGFSASIPACVRGECVLDHCQAGYEDRDGDWSNGCESDCVAGGAVFDPCDGRDNDCDGFTDEDFLPQVCGSGVCSSSSACIEGSILTCEVGEGVDDEYVCDGVDEDCDGFVDEGLGRNCDTPCGSGHTVCSGGEEPGCVALSDEGGACVNLRAFCEPVRVPLTLPLPSSGDELFVDAFWIVDLSGSFRDDLRTFIDRSQELTDQVFASVPGVHVGLASFSAPPCRGSLSDFGYELNLPLTPMLSELTNALRRLDIVPGGLESQLEAMYQALTGEGFFIAPGDCDDSSIPPTTTGWRPGGLKHILLSTDEFFSFGGSFPYTHGVSEVVDAALSAGARVSFLWAGGIPDPDAYVIADLTGGDVYLLTEDSSGVVEAIVEATVGTVRFADVELQVEGDTMGFVADIEPRFLEGVDLTTNENINATVTVVSPIGPDGTEQQFDMSVVFVVNGVEVARRPLTISLPPDDPKDCIDRPPLVDSIRIPSSLGAGETVRLEAELRLFDEDETLHEWRATAGTVLEPNAASTLYSAPGQPGLVNVGLTVSDAAGGSHGLDQIVQVLGGDCPAELPILTVGHLEGGVSTHHAVNSRLADGSCGEPNFELAMVLDVRRPALYELGMIPDTGYFHLRQGDCETEVACEVNAEPTVFLETGQYYLFAEVSEDWDMPVFVTVTPSAP